jgi:hypothetical protein
MKKTLLPVFAALFAFSMLQGASDSYKLNEAILTQWKQDIKNQAVREVVIHLKRAEGDGNTYINLRFGREGKTLDGSKRVYLPDTKWRKISWNVGGMAPHGKPLILNVYNGKVSVDYVQVMWQ